MILTKGYIISILKQHYIYIIISAVIFVVMMIVTRKKANGRIALCAFVSYVFLVLSSVFLTRSTSTDFRYEIVPFWSYIAIIRDNDKNLISQIIANIIMFIPIGFLSPYVLNIKKKSILIGVGLSCLIEVVQLVFRLGLFEFDDIIHNTLGTVIGYGIYLLVEKIRKDTKNKKTSS